MTTTDIDTPAVAGGSPAKKTPFNKSKRYGEEELAELRAAIDQGTLFYAQGQKVKQMEQDFAAAVGAKHAIATSSGTASIHAAMIAAGISPGDEVIVPPVTDMGSIIPVMFQGAVPVFADLDPHTYNLHPDAVEKVITEKTRAILPVHLAGVACDMTGLKRVADKHSLVMIEDCAQAHGTQYDGKPVGTIGEIGCFSFNEFKHIACGDGGVVVTNDETLAKRLRLATDKCYDRTAGAATRNATFLANNYRMSELQGAVALAQLKKLPSIVERRRDWATKLAAQIDDLPGLHLPQVPENSSPSWWFYMMRVVPQKLRADADQFANALRKEGLPVSAHYIGQCIYEYPMFTEHTAFARGGHPFERHTYAKGACPVAEEILDTCVILHLNENYNEQDLEETVLAIRRTATWFHRTQ
jgi:perosamine synthetase